jgi:hypothetical protein
VHDGDLRLLERGIELVELRRLELELVERERELVRVELTGPVPALEQALTLVAGQNFLDRRSSGSALCFFGGQAAPLPRRRSQGSYGSGGRQSVRTIGQFGHGGSGRLDGFALSARMRATKGGCSCRQHCSADEC